MSLAPASIACRTAFLISAGSTSAGRNSSSTLIWAASLAARSGRVAEYCSIASRLILMPFRSTSTTSSSVAGRRRSISRFFRLARMVPSTRVRSLSCALRAAFIAVRRASATLAAGDTRAPAVLADRGVHLPLPLFARLLEVTVLAKVGQDPRLLALLLEALQRPLEALVIVNDDFRHAVYHPSRPGWA